MDDGLSISELKNVLDMTLETGVVPLVEGPPGVGKSSVIREIASNRPYTINKNKEISKLSDRLSKVYGSSHTGVRVKPVHLGICNPTEIKGIPVFDIRDGDAVWKNTRLFPVDPHELKQKEDELVDTYAVRSGLKEKDSNYSTLTSKINRLESFIEEALHEQHALLFLDELTQAPSSVQNAAFSLILDRTIGTYTLPKDVIVIAAGNRKKDMAGANTLNTALTSRFVKLTLDNPTLEDFTQYSIDNGIDSEILGFLNFKRDLLFEFNPSIVGVSFPCPRTWEFSSNHLKVWKKRSTSSNDLYQMLGGCIGFGAAMMFVNWRNLYVKLPDPNDVLNGDLKRSEIDFIGIANSEKGKDNISMADDISLIHAFTLSMIDHLSDDPTPKRCTNMIRFLLDEKNSRLEWATIATKTLLIRHEDLIQTFFDLPEWTELTEKLDFDRILTQ